MTKDFLSKMTLDIRCTSCGKQTAQSLAWLKSHDELICRVCATPIAIDRRQISAAVDQASKAITKFGTGFGKL